MWQIHLWKLVQHLKENLHQTIHSNTYSNKGSMNLGQAVLQVFRPLFSPKRFLKWEYSFFLILHLVLRAHVELCLRVFGKNSIHAKVTKNGRWKPQNWIFYLFWKHFLISFCKNRYQMKVGIVFCILLYTSHV